MIKLLIKALDHEGLRFLKSPRLRIKIKNFRLRILSSELKLNTEDK